MSASQNQTDIPKHVAIILDGNRRWAKQQHLPTLIGHREGYQNLKNLAPYIIERGVQNLTAFVFSTENWQRSSEEVSYLMDLIERLLIEDFDFLKEHDLRLRWLGSPEGLKTTLVTKLEETVAKSAHHTHGQLNLCFNYGSRLDIVNAVRQLMTQGVRPDDINPDALGQNLTSAGLPDPDLIIRTSGEQRLSNFLLWEAAYSELYFSEKMWPDFDEAEFDKALAEYSLRNRRHGK